MLLAMAGVLVALGLLLYSWSSTTNFVPLYSGLDNADSGRIVDQLRSQGVPFELTAGGQSISVPEAQVDELRVGFAAQGLPEGGNVGFELFDGNAFTATDFVQRLNFQRGLQGELARTIESFSAVEQARVHIVLPERSLFSADERDATASIVLRMRPGRTLAADEVAGVAHMVSGAVEGLDKSRITIIDTSGSILFDGLELEQGGVGGNNSQLAVQQAYERVLERDVQQLLDRALGPGRSAVKVRVTIDFDQLETETETFTTGTESGVPRSSTTVTESYTTAGDAVAGAVPGAAANIPGVDSEAVPEAAGDAATTAYSRTETTSNFEVGRTVTRSVKASGDIERLSVSLLLDETITEEQAASLLETVRAAVGIDDSRGDVIAMTRIPFDRTALEEAEAAFAADASTAQLFGYVRLALPIVVLAVAFFFFRMLMRSVSTRGAVAYSQLAPAAGGGAAVAGAIEAPGQKGSTLPPPPADLTSEVEQQVTRLAETSPDTVANVVQSWVRED